jgi:tight adherence protein C
VDETDHPDPCLAQQIDLMTLQQIVFLTATFGFVTSLTWLALSIASGARRQRRLSRLTKQDSLKAARGRWREHILALVRPFAKFAAPKEDSEDSPLRLKFLRAGYRSDSAATVYLALKSIAVVMLPTVFFVFGPDGLRPLQTAFWSIILAAAGYYLPDFVLRQKTLRRQRELLNNFPDAVDLLTVCVEAGLGLDAALSRVTDEIKHKCAVLADELHLVNLELRAGGTRQQALRNLARRTGLEELNALVAMLVQAERFGTSIADSLRIYSSELRAKRRVKAEEAAAKIALKLLFPLMFCLFPALMLVLMGPGIINIHRHLLPTMGGG